MYGSISFDKSTAFWAYDEMSSQELGRNKSQQQLEEQIRTEDFTQTIHDLSTLFFVVEFSKS